MKEASALQIKPRKFKTPGLLEAPLSPTENLLSEESKSQLSQLSSSRFAESMKYKINMESIIEEVPEDELSSSSDGADRALSMNSFSVTIKQKSVTIF